MRKYYVLLLGLIFTVLACSTKEEKVQPNILYILCDDLGYADVGFNGSPDIKTPALDALAHDGTIFSSAYVTHPFCGPSRAGIMTGRYPHEYGAPFNLPPNIKQTPQMDPQILGVPLEETFISKVLQDAGYFTGVVGKWHMGHEAKFHPNNRGFDEFYGFLGGGHNYFPEQYRAAYKKQKANGVELVFEYLLPLEHNGKEVRETEYITDALSRECINFIGKAAEKEQPFFLYLSYNAPHSPLQAKEEDKALYAHIKDEKRRTYAAMVHAVDRGVSEIVEALKANGQYENTLILFHSDNGGKLSLGANNYPLKAGKGSTQEGGYRTPMFFHWPGVVPQGKVFEHVITSLDFYPTFAHLAGASIPEEKVLSGRNIWDDFLAGKPLHDDMIYCMRHRIGLTDVGVRKGDWKILRTSNAPWKLFKISEDISEDQDLSEAYPDVLKNMIDEAEAWALSLPQPLWFHIQEEGDLWHEKNMPLFDETFAQ